MRNLFGIALLLALPASALAQVGHAPKTSPYRDIHKGHTLTAMGGYFKGDGGRFGIGPHGDYVFGGRYDIRSASAFQIGIGVYHGNLNRLIVDPFVVLANRVKGPVKQSVTFAEIALQFNITGGKTWHRFAPFLAASGGLAFASSTPTDTSGYNFGNKFFLAPTFGVRVFLTERLHLRAEARANFWKLNYPDTFRQPPIEQPAAPPVIVGGSITEWVSSRWVQVGLGYSFTP
ncbi:MAG TPA: hypothetical protein VGN76_15730 [Gemmatimonadales bacterium]|jgi:hypothetical protein|nr:hypothetical protein [Gemmatimonadales bacterium]